jgi:hypothetical protein
MQTARWTPCVKLTDAAAQSYNSTQWGEGVTNPAGVLSGAGGLCSAGFYHGYRSPELALFLNPIHANFLPARLWLAEYRGTVEDNLGLKFGATEMRTVKELSVPKITGEQRVAFALFASAQVYDGAAFSEWASAWLSGEDRSEASARATSSAAYRAARAAADSAAYWAAASATSSAAYWAAHWAAASAAYWAAASAAASTAPHDLLDNAVAWALSREW